MKFLYSERFKKAFRKMPKNIQDRFHDRLKIFIENPTNPLLKIHSLKGNLAGYWAFSITGDYRVIYLKITRDCLELCDIGSHNQVY